MGRTLAPILLAILLAPAWAQKVVHAPAEPLDLGVANVSLEMYGWEESDRRWTPAPGLASGDGSMREQRTSARYQMALAGRWPGGSREIFGFVGGPYPNESNFLVVAFERRDSEILIFLRRLDTGGKGDGYRSWKIVYLSALLPVELPEGNYVVRCIVHDGAGQPDAMSRPIPAMDLAVPHPDQLERRERLAQLRALTDEQLLREYLAAGEALANSPLGPREVPVSDLPAFEYNDVRYLRFRDTADEIARRGTSMGPWLRDRLQREIPRTTGSTERHPFGLARSIIELLAQTGDARSVPLLIDVLDGLDGKAIMPIRHAALDALEQLTHVTFRMHNLIDGRTRWAVEDPRARPVDREDPIFSSRGPGWHANAFRVWLSEQGNDPKRWASQAQRRARSAMESSDLRAVFAAAEFLQHEHRDDDPSATLKRLGQIVSNARQVGFRPPHYEYQFQGATLPLTIEDWTGLLAYYGPRARLYAKALIRIDQEIAMPSPPRIADMAHVGGEEILDYLVARLVELEQRLAAAQLDATLDLDQISEERIRQTVLAIHLTRWGIWRWAGRIFDDTDQIVQWWDQHRHQPMIRWLRANMEMTAAQADQGDPRAQYLLRALLTELPDRGDDAPWNPAAIATAPADRPVQPTQRYRVQWIRANDPWLVYNFESGGFRLDPSAFP